MESNKCDVNHLDSDVLLPPRKRLLACLKKQNGDGSGNGNVNVNGNSSSCSNSQSTCSSLNNLDARISYLLRAHLSNENPSQEEIVAASRSAAEDAVKVATAARAAAKEKAVIAAKAMAAAKKALELVATIDDDQEILPCAEQHLKKNKPKKHVNVQMLYDNKKPRLENGKTNDEELARKLHQAINSSPRISKGGLPSDTQIYKHKKLKSSHIFDHGTRISNEGIVGEGISPSSNGAGKAYDKEVENTIKSKTENGDAERILQLKAKFGEDDIAALGRKRGRMKQKKLPLSICHDKAQSTTPKGDGTTSTSWKCQAFKAPVSVKQNKVLLS